MKTNMKLHEANVVSRNPWQTTMLEGWGDATGPLVILGWIVPELCTTLLLAAGFQTCTVSAHLPTDVLRSHTNSSTPVSMLVCTTSRHMQGWKVTDTFKHTAPVPAKLRCGCWWKSTTSMSIWWSVVYPGLHRPFFQNVHKVRLGKATWSTPGAMSSITAP